MINNIATSKSKNFCSIHHFYYSGQLCPFCLSDKVVALGKKFSNKDAEHMDAHKKKKDDV